MATRPFIRNEVMVPNSIIWTWSGLQITDDGDPVALIYGDGQLHVQVSGTLGTGGTLIIEGSVTGTHWGTLILSNNNAASYTTLNAGALRGMPPLIRPRVTAGDANTNLTVHLSFAGGKLLG